MLSLLIWLPVGGALLTALLSAQAAKICATITSTIVLFLNFLLITQFNLAERGFQLQENLSWLSSIGLDYTLGIDGLSLPLLVLNGLITWLVICFDREITDRKTTFYVLILLIHSGVSGALLSLNTLLFVLFYEVELIPVYLLIAIWGGKQKNYAAIKFLLFTAISGIFILAGFLALAWINPAKQGLFDYQTLRSLSLPLTTQVILLLLLLVGFSIKAPFVPFHTWLPDTYVETSTPGVMILGGVVAKLGTYGLFRFCLGLFPDAWSALSPWIALWAGLGILYGAVIAIAQKDIKRMVAYSSIGHMSYVLLAGAGNTPLSLVGGIAQMVSHGLILALLFALVGIIENKVGTRELDVLNGLLNPLRGFPTISALLILGGMASAGIPGMVGFIAEFLVFQGSFSRFPLPTLLAILGTGLTAVYFVILLNRTCFGRLDNNTAYYPKVFINEQIPVFTLTALIILLGLQPQIMTKVIEPTASQMSGLPVAQVFRSTNLTR
jgi:NAD(P)H-quinone oxidoreductase subunit 4